MKLENLMLKYMWNGQEPKFLERGMKRFAISGIIIRMLTFTYYFLAANIIFKIFTFKILLIATII